MKTSAWMPLWIGDYLADTMHLTTEQHGAYLLLIMGYWRHGGPLPDDDEQLAAITHLMRDAWLAHRPRIVLFFRVADGRWHHKRIDAELELAGRTHASRVKAAATAAKARWGRTAPGPPVCVTHPLRMPDASVTDTPSQSPSPVATHTPDAERPGWEEVKAHAQTIGLAEWRARDWFDEMEACGWLDSKHRPVLLWRPLLARIKAFWEADGRPPAPISRAPVERPQGGAKPSVDAAFWRLREELKLVEDELRRAVERAGADAMGQLLGTPEEMAKIRRLRGRRAELKKELGLG